MTPLGVDDEAGAGLLRGDRSRSTSMRTTAGSTCVEDAADVAGLDDRVRGTRAAVARPRCCVRTVLRLRVVVERDEEAAGDERTDERAGDAADDRGAHAAAALRRGGTGIGAPVAAVAPAAAGWRASVLHAHEGGGGSLLAGAGITGSTGGSESVTRLASVGYVPSVAELVHDGRGAGGRARSAGIGVSVNGAGSGVGAGSPQAAGGAM